VSKEYHIKLNGELIPVTEEVYRAYQQPKWREKKRAKVREGKDISLDVMLEKGDLKQPNLGQALVDDVVADKLLLDELLSALAELNNDERSLIDEIFYKEKSEREVAKFIGCSKTGIHKQKEKILSKLQDLLKTW